MTIDPGLSWRRSATQPIPLTFAPKRFTWQGEKADGLPIICDSDGSACEPLTIHFGQSFRFKRVRMSSLRDEAYILREWWSYLSMIDRWWASADDQAMIDWRELLKVAATSTTTMKAPGISRKLEIVFTFYDHAFYYGFSGRELVGINGPITLKVADGAHHAGAGRGVRREWVCGEGKNPGMVRRPTPDETAVQ